MPARIVVVHDDPEFTDGLVEILGPDVVWFTDPVRALIALESARTVAFLITRLQFTDSQPVGLSLARLAKAARPDVRVMFIGAPRYRDDVRELGEFIAEPVSAAHVGILIEWLGSPLVGQAFGRTGGHHDR
jgi:CheY-like chemotaxis protein